MEEEQTKNTKDFRAKNEAFIRANEVLLEKRRAIAASQREKEEAESS